MIGLKKKRFLSQRRNIFMLNLLKEIRIEKRHGLRKRLKRSKWRTGFRRLRPKRRRIKRSLKNRRLRYFRKWRALKLKNRWGLKKRKLGVRWWKGKKVKKYPIKPRRWLNWFKKNTVDLTLSWKKKKFESYLWKYLQSLKNDMYRKRRIHYTRVYKDAEIWRYLKKKGRRFYLKKRKHRYLIKKRPVPFKKDILERYLQGCTSFKVTIGPNQVLGYGENAKLKSWDESEIWGKGGLVSKRRQGSEKQEETSSRNLEKKISVFLRKKYKIGSYFSRVIKGIPSFLEYNLYGDTQRKKFKRIPRKLPKSRNLSKKLFKVYYAGLSHKWLRKLFRSGGTKKSVSQQKNGQNSLLKRSFLPHGGKSEKKPLQMHGKGKAFILDLETRLGPSVLRVLNFKPKSLRKKKDVRVRNKRLLVREGNKKRRLTLKYFIGRGGLGQRGMTAELKKIRKKLFRRLRKRRRPSRKVGRNLSAYTWLRVKQLINHGHIGVTKFREIRRAEINEIPTYDSIRYIGRAKKAIGGKPGGMIRTRRAQNHIKKEGRPKSVKIRVNMLDRLDVQGYVKNLGFSQKARYGLEKGVTGIAKQGRFYKKVPLDMKMLRLLGSRKRPLGGQKAREKRRSGIQEILIGTHNATRDWQKSLKANEKSGKSMGDGAKEATALGIVKNIQKSRLEKNLKKSFGLNKILSRSASKSPSGSILFKKYETGEEKFAGEKTIKNLKLKRYTEAFYITYKNLNLIPRLVCRANEKDAEEQKTGSHVKKSGMRKAKANQKSEQGLERITWHDVEKEIQPIYEKIGLNQSVYTLWPVVWLLKARPWSEKLRKEMKNMLSPKLPEHKEPLAGSLREKIQEVQRKRKLAKTLLYYAVVPDYTTKAKAYRNLLKERSKWEPPLSERDSEGLKKVSLTKVTTKGGSNQSILGQVRYLDEIYGYEPEREDELPWEENYAFKVFETKYPKLVRWQQKTGSSSSSYSDVFQKCNFMKMELDFFHYISEYYGK